MCYRYSFLYKKANEVLEERLAREDREKANVYHASAFDPTPRPVITQQEPNKISYMQWGLMPEWIKADDVKGQRMGALPNARCETAFTTNAFKKHLPKTRLIVPATGFFEHKHVKNEKGKDDTRPYHIQVLDTEMEHPEPKTFFFGGFYSIWNGSPRFSILTTEANALMREIHNNPKNPFRMPLILTDAEALLWIQNDLSEETIKSMMHPYPAEAMSAYTISKDITSKKVDPNRAETLEPFDYEHTVKQDPNALF